MFNQIIIWGEKQVQYNVIFHKTYHLKHCSKMKVVAMPGIEHGLPGWKTEILTTRPHLFLLAINLAFIKPKDKQTELNSIKTYP